MALPQQAIERMVRGPAQTPGAYQNLLLLTSAVLLLVFLLYAGLAFGYIPYLERQSAGLDEQIKQFAEQVSGEEQEELRIFYSQLANLKTILANHTISAPVFASLENNTLPQVYFTRARLDVNLGEMVLEGAAPRGEDVALQAALFERAPEVARVNVKSVSRVSENVQRFNITIYFAPEFLKEAAARP